ncbi:MAG: NAD(P)H-dependent oxidoreductase [Gammaproteobacteria bacterium]|nr:NAD(P)H-dependent oxidoreductase [Gammaproteobacteria bacterium]
MNKKVFIINGHQYWEISKGELNASLVEFAKDQLEQNGFTVKTTHIDDAYDIAREIDKFLWADFIIFQTPVYWFSIPWGFKKYIDEVYMAGRGKLFEGDGRTRSDPEIKYGSGGLMQGKKYMLSTTWNAPLEAFTDDQQIFEGRNVDQVFFYFHKAQQFMGMTHLSAFACHDVLKNPDMENDFKRYKIHLAKQFGL